MAKRSKLSFTMSILDHFLQPSDASHCDVIQRIKHTEVHFRSFFFFFCFFFSLLLHLLFILVLTHGSTQSVVCCVNNIFQTYALKMNSLHLSKAHIMCLFSQCYRVYRTGLSFSSISMTINCVGEEQKKKCKNVVYSRSIACFFLFFLFFSFRFSLSLVRTFPCTVRSSGFRHESGGRKNRSRWTTFCISRLDSSRWSG